MSAVEEQYRKQLARCRCSVDRSLETLGAEAWQQAAMVEVSVRQHDKTDCTGFEAERHRIAGAYRCGTLKQSAVNEKPGLPPLKQKARPRDLLGGSVKCNVHRAYVY